MTVHDLVAQLSAAECVPAIEEDELVFDRDVPDDLLPFVEVLQSGLRAYLTGRKWFGIDSTGHGAARPDGLLAFSDLLPDHVSLLAVEGEVWDRVPWHAPRSAPTDRAFGKQRGLRTTVRR